MAAEHKVRCACKPKVKTDIILKNHPADAQPKEINSTPQGPLIITNKAKNLGLMVHNNKPWKDDFTQEEGVGRTESRHGV